MRAAIRSLGVLLLAGAAAVVMGVSSALMSVVAVAATTALVMGGTQHSLNVDPNRQEIPDTQQFVNDYVAGANGKYIHCGGCAAVGVVTPEEFFPTVGTISFNQSVQLGRENLDRCLKGSIGCTHTDTSPLSGTTTGSLPAGTYKVFGYSQSATIVTVEKRSLAEEFDDNQGPDVTFDVIGNPNRPNGGLVSRGPEGLTIPFLDVTFSGSTPTDTQYQTTDTTRQYDGLSESPLNPLNLLADVNAFMGSILLHPDYFGPSVPQPILQDEYGDTTYYLIPTPTVPLLIPVEQIPTVGPVVAAVLNAPLQVLVEAGYDRTISPGEPTPWNVLYTPNPVALATNFLVAVPAGLDDAVSLAADDPNLRPFQTERPGPYGVGGPPVTMNPTTNDQLQQSTALTGSEVEPAATNSDKEPALGNDVARQSLTNEQAVPSSDADKIAQPAAKTPRPKIRNPMGTDRLGLRDIVSTIKQAFSKPDRKDPPRGDLGSSAADGYRTNRSGTTSSE